MEEEFESRLAMRWEELDTDVLVSIFQKVSVDELTSVLSHVCRSWRAACCDPILWKTLDLSHQRHIFFNLQSEPYVYVPSAVDEALTRSLKTYMDHSKGNTRTLIFHFQFFLNDDQLTYTAERCPGLRRLVLPAWNRIRKTAICKAIRFWKDLESLTMPSIAKPAYLLKAIAENCKNFKELKIMGPFEVLFASALITWLPNLKILSLRCSAIKREALMKILDGLPSLEVLNISHSHLVEYYSFSQPKVIVRELDNTLLEKTARLKRLLTCMAHTSCVMCQRTENDEGIMRWHEYEGEWKVDEVRSLQL